MKYPILLFCLMIVASCSQDAEPSLSSVIRDSSEAHEGEKLERKFKSQAASGFIQDKKGNWVTDTSKRSQFESGGRSNMAGKSFQGKQFYKSEAIAPSYWSQSAYPKTAYSGNTDASSLKKSNASQGIFAREAGAYSSNNGKNVQSNRLGSPAAIEERKNQINRVNDARTSNRRNYENDLFIMDAQQMRDLNIQQTKAMMGR